MIVTDSFAGLWTDSRYFVQAREQLLDSGFSFMKPADGGWHDYLGWLTDNVSDLNTVAIDSRTVSIAGMRKIERSLEGKNVKYITDSDLISEIWTDRPAISGSPAFDFPVIYAGKERTLKISEVRSLMKIRNIDYHLLTSVADIMWLLNIRGNDVKYSPLFLSFAIVSDDQILLFTDENKIPFKLAFEFDR